MNIMFGYEEKWGYGSFRCCRKNQETAAAIWYWGTKVASLVHIFRYIGGYWQLSATVSVQLAEWIMTRGGVLPALIAQPALW